MENEHRHKFTVRWRYDFLDRLMLPIPFRLKEDKLCSCGVSEYLHKKQTKH